MIIFQITCKFRVTVPKIVARGITHAAAQSVHEYVWHVK